MYLFTVIQDSITMSLKIKKNSLKRFNVALCLQWVCVLNLANHVHLSSRGWERQVSLYFEFGLQKPC